MAHFTLDDFESIHREEQRLLRALFPQEAAAEVTFSPSDDAVNAVLNYAKSTSHPTVMPDNNEALFWN